jgi:hypothetical protein
MKNHVLLLAACLLMGCKSAKVTEQRDLSSATVAKPGIIYVADFELDAQKIQHEEGVLSGRPGPVGRVSERLYGTSQNPEARARKLVNLMADTLVKDLLKGGLTSARLAPGAPLPTQGWLVRGVFAEVQEGNRLRRAVIGFGVGQTDLQVVTVIDDLAQGTPKSFYELATEARSGQTPGAGPTLAFGPYGAAARFVMAGQDLDQNVRQTASQIATRVADHVAQAKPEKLN